MPATVSHHTTQSGTTRTLPGHGTQRLSDTGLPETQRERHERLMADTRPVKVKGVARILGLSSNRVRELRRFRLLAEQAVADPEATDAERAAAADWLNTTAIPATQDGPDPHGDDALWWRACDIYRWGRTANPPRLNEWYEPVEGGADPPGRTPGGTPAFRSRRPSFADQLRALQGVEVDEATAAALRQPLLNAYHAARAAGVLAAKARDTAARAAAAQAGVGVQVARKVLLQSLADAPREPRGEVG